MAKFRKSELTVSCDSNATRRNCLGVLISVLVLTFISSLIVAAIVIINPDITSLPARGYAQREAITLEEALLGDLAANSFTFEWLPPSSSLDRSALDNANDVLLYEDLKNLHLLSLPSAGEPNGTTFDAASTRSETNYHVRFKPDVSTVVANSSLLASIDFKGYKISPSQRYLLIWTTKTKQFRHSFTAKYFLYDTKLDLISMLSTRPATGVADGQLADEPAAALGANLHHTYEHLDSASLYLNEVDEGDKQSRFQRVDWFASGARDSLIMVQDNDIYLLADVAGDERRSDGKVQRATPVRLTSTGRINEIFNGIPDWLYEEEILADVPALLVSPNSTTLAYMSFNDSLVELMPFSVYGSSERVVPRTQRIRYPKAGRVNPQVSVHLIDDLMSSSSNTNQQHHIQLQLPEDLGRHQHYINRINWLGDDHLALVWLNRNQNESHFVICAREFNWRCQSNLHLRSPGGWLELSDDLIPLDEQHYLTLLFKDEGADVGAFKHVAKVSLKQPNSYTFLTSGRREVTQINSVDRKNALLYYTSTVENEPGQRQLFAVSLNNGESNESDRDRSSSANKTTAADTCVTCGHYPEECLYNYAKLSPSNDYYIFECEGPGVPRTELRLTPVRLNSDRLLLLESQKRLELQQGRRRRRRRQQEQQIFDVTLKAVEQHPTNSTKSESPSASERIITDFNGTSTSTSTFATTSSHGRRLDASNVSNLNNLPPANSGELSSASSSSSSSSPSLALAGKEHSIATMPHRRRSSSDDGSLLWTIDNNQALRDKLTFSKAMPLTMRLKVPIANTNYSANVIMFLPPQMGASVNTFRAASPQAAAAAAVYLSSGRALPARMSLSGSGSGSGAASLEQALHGHFTRDSIAEYARQLTSGEQYPMVVDVYGGPNSQRVDYRFHVGYGHYLASTRRTVYAMIDGRGSGYQGTKRLYELYHKFGTVEIQDQIEVAAYLARNFSFIDATKVAIWGWSYGGYASAMALAQSNLQALLNLQTQLNSSSNADKTDSNSSTDHHLHRYNDRIQFLQPGTAPKLSLKGVFECAVSVAPVTNWIYYDTAYTERYMSSPYVNERYDSSLPGDHLRKPSSGSHLTSKPLAFSAAEHDHGFMANALGGLWLPLNRTIDAYLKSRPPPSTTTTSSQRQTSPSLVGLNDRYIKASLLEHIANIDKKRFLLIHGTADDNVHFQQSIMLMKRMVQKNVLYETRLYPDQDHSISNKADKLHLYSTLSNFFAECFDMVY